MLNTDNDPSILESTSNNCRFVSPLCDFMFDDAISLLGKKRIEVKCINYNEILLCCKTHADMTRTTSHGEKMKSHLCDSKDEQFCIDEIGSLNNYSIGKQDDISKQENDENSQLSTTKWNQQVREESADNLIAFDASNLSEENNTISVISEYKHKNGEVTLHLENFYLPYQYERTNNQNNQIFNAKCSLWIFWKNHVLMCKELNLLGGHSK